VINGGLSEAGRTAPGAWFDKLAMNGIFGKPASDLIRNSPTTGFFVAAGGLCPMLA
jgi:hypothetical protein